eukprot:XP_001704374.1 Hypothetical protein GL50803_31763 [Giardia lamblia ATCC 50803]
MCHKIQYCHMEIGLLATKPRSHLLKHKLIRLLLLLLLGLRGSVVVILRGRYGSGSCSTRPPFFSDLC